MRLSFLSPRPQVLLFGAIAGLLIVCDIPQSNAGALKSPVDDPPSDLVFFTEDYAGEPRWGCDGISVFGLEEGPIHLGKQQVSPGRMAGNSDLSTIIAIRTNGHFDFTMSWRDDEAPDGWADGGIDLPIDGWRATFSGGIAITPDNAYVLAAANQGGSWASNCEAERFGVIQLRLAELDPTARTAGPVRNAFVSTAPVGEILLADGGRLAHLVVPKRRPRSPFSNSYLHTVETETLTEVAPPIELPDLGGISGSECGFAPSYTHAALSPDERFVVVNSRERPELVVVDLVERRAWTVPLRGVPGLEAVGGVAFNWAPTHHGLLAVHGLTSIGMFTWLDGGVPNRLSWAPIERPYGNNTSGPIAALAWSADGTTLIAAQGGREAEFGSWTVTEEGRELVRARSYEACAHRDDNFPNDVFTGNGLLPPPTPIPSASPSPTPSQTPSPSATVPPTATPTMTPSATPEPGPIYLPLGLRERCVPDIRRVDVALVIDASSSMMEITPAGGTKLAAAMDAAEVFLDQLRFDRGDRAAIVAFHSSASLLAPLTEDRVALEGAIRAIEAGRETCLVCGVETGAAELAGPRHTVGHQATLILLTDGRSNPRPASEAADRAALAKADGMLLFMVGLGADVDDAVLSAMASRPEYYYRAPRAEQLADIYIMIAGAIPCPAGAFWGGR